MAAAGGDRNPAGDDSAAARIGVAGGGRAHVSGHDFEVNSLSEWDVDRVGAGWRDKVPVASIGDRGTVLHAMADVQPTVSHRVRVRRSNSLSTEVFQ